MALIQADVEVKLGLLCVSARVRVRHVSVCVCLSDGCLCCLLMRRVVENIVKELQENVRKAVNLDEAAAGHNKRKLIQQAVIKQVCC